MTTKGQVDRTEQRSRGGSGSGSKPRNCTRLVHEQVGQDIMLQEMLTKGILNLRRTSRYLIEELGLDHSEEAVNSALRRWTQDDVRLHPARAVQAAAEGTLAFETGFHAYRLQAEPKALRAIHRMHANSRAPGTVGDLALRRLAIFRSRTEICVILAPDGADHLPSMLEPWVLGSWEACMGRVSFGGPPGDHLLATSRLMAFLAYYGVDILGHHSGRSEVVVFAREEDAVPLNTALCNFKLYGSHVETGSPK